MNTQNPATQTETGKKLNALQLIVRVFVASASLLLIPYAASFITEEMEWTASDYFIVWVMLFVTGTFYAFISRLSSGLIYRSAVAVSCFTGLFMVWSNLAVGIIGNEDNPVNLVYFILIMVGLIASFAVRFKPRGLAYVTGGMAIALAVIAAYAIIAGYHHAPESSLTQIVGVHMIFITPLSIAAILFHQEPGQEIVQ